MENVLIYCEAENIWIASKDHSNSETINVNWDRLITEVGRDRSVLVDRIYAPDMSYLEGTSSSLFKSNRIGKQKINTFAVADCVDDLITFRYNGNASKNSTIILLLGKLGIKRLIEIAIKYQYNVEIWTYGDETYDDKPICSNVTTHQLESIFGVITY